MPLPYPKDRGYSLIELLTVLAIVGVLSTVGVAMIGNRPSGAVRSVMDELEGVLASAHKRAVATGQDIVLTTRGEWDVADPMALTYTGVAANGSEGFTLAHSATGILREHMHAGVVTVTHADWWATAGTGSDSLDGVPPFNDSKWGFQTSAVAAPDPQTDPPTPAVPAGSILATNALNLFQGGAAAPMARISGSSKRFTATRWIQVVALSGGHPLPGGPRGVLVVLGNGATIYKFYNPGILNGGNGRWRRI